MWTAPITLDENGRRHDTPTQRLVNSDFAHDFFKPGAVFGTLPTLLATSITVYAVGRVRDQPKLSHTGMDLIQALMVSEAVNFATQRERPDGTPRSFPSGHASDDTFAVATALERHLGWRGAVPAYIAASYVAISRLPATRHWLSDVVFGSSRRWKRNTSSIIGRRRPGARREGSESP